MHPETARRGRLLHVALAFLGLEVPPAAMPSGLRALHAWLGTWHGIGLIEQGMARQDRDLSLTRYRDRWGATVFVTGKEHAVMQGTGWQMTPWEAVQQAASQAPAQGPVLECRPAGSLAVRRRLGSAGQQVVNRRHQHVVSKWL